VSSVVVDTDVASTILKGQLPDNLAHRLSGQQLATTFVTIGELTQWTYLHRWGPQRKAGLRAFLASVVVMPCGFHAATAWGGIQATPGSEGALGRSTTPGCRLLHRPRSSTRHVQHQGLRRLRRARETKCEQKAQVERQKASAITGSTGLRRRERTFESCRGTTLGLRLLL
jgi:predicted nucleic acid-binding protein